MSIHLDIQEGTCSPTESQLVARAAESTLKHQSVPDEAALSIVVTDDESIQTLNRQYRQIDAPTDVLSFPAEFVNPENKKVYLGDVIISYQRAEAQAQMRGHLVEEELQLLVVHGVLHLFGHDHVETEEKAAMWNAQAEILAELGIDEITLPE